MEPKTESKIYKKFNKETKIDQDLLNDLIRGFEDIKKGRVRKVR